ncbi:MAG: hypothetical protein ACJ76S_10785 [Solirubrobacteraceae bacterium]
MPRLAPAEGRPLRLGAVADDGIAASIYALVERGIHRRPALSRQIHGEIELRFDEELAPVRLVFDDQAVTVEDGSAHQPDLVISGRLPHVVALATAPLLGGVPNPANRRGRAALARIANRRVRVTGNRTLGRKLLRLLAL